MSGWLCVFGEDEISDRDKLGQSVLEKMIL